MLTTILTAILGIFTGVILPAGRVIIMGAVGLLITIFPTVAKAIWQGLVYVVKGLAWLIQKAIELVRRKKADPVILPPTPAADTPVDTTAKSE